MPAKPTTTARDGRKSSFAGSHPYVRVALLMALFAMIVPNGAVEAPISQVSAIFLLLVLGYILSTTPFNQSVRRPVMVGLICFCPLFALCSLQFTAMPLGAHSHPVWNELGETFEVSHGYLSVNPSRSLNALASLILPFLTFFAVFLISQQRQTARALWHGVAGLGLTVLLLSIILEIFFPNTYFFSDAPMKNGVFNGVFRNRNVAAAFFVLTGFAVLGSLALVQEKTQKKRRSSKSRKSRDGFVSKGGLNGVLGHGLLIILFFICIFAIVTTKSRAGVLSGLPLLFFCLSLVLMKMSVGRKTKNLYKIPIILIATFFLFIITLILSGGPVLSRFESAQVDSRYCVHKGTVEAIISNFPWGTGLGTFQDVFPIYRSADCGSPSQIWHRAHNSFLELTLTSGIIGVTVLALLTAWILYKGLVNLRPRSDRQFMPVLLVSLLTYLILHSMADFPLQIPGVVHYSVVLIACAIAISQESFDEQRTGSNEGI